MYLKLLWIAGNLPSAVKLVNPKVPNSGKVRSNFQKWLEKEVYEPYILLKEPSMGWTVPSSLQSSKSPRDCCLTKKQLSGALVGGRNYKALAYLLPAHFTTVLQLCFFAKPSSVCHFFPRIQCQKTLKMLLRTVSLFLPFLHHCVMIPPHVSFSLCCPSEDIYFANKHGTIISLIAQGKQFGQ